MLQSILSFRTLTTTEAVQWSAWCMQAAAMAGLLEMPADQRPDAQRQAIKNGLVPVRFALIHCEAPKSRLGLYVRHGFCIRFQ